mgnify:CR=1 FL=1
MNLPNKLTILGLIMTPLFLAALVIPFSHHLLVALILFAAASLTDYIDGKMARKQGLVTDFGKFLDPLADKMLTTAAFLFFLSSGVDYYGMVWIVFIVLTREFVVTSVRLIAADNGKVIAATIWGKLKTVSQMVSSIGIMLAIHFVNAFSFTILFVALAFAGADRGLLRLAHDAG